MYMMRRIPRLITHAEPMVPVVRPGEQIYVDGKPIRRDPTRLYIRALVEPLSGRQQLILPEGDRNTERYSVYQDPSQTENAPSRAPNPGGLAIGDEVLANGVRCVVEQVKDWGRVIEAQVVKVDVSQSTKVDFPALPERFAR